MNKMTEWLCETPQLCHRLQRDQLRNRAVCTELMSIDLLAGIGLQGAAEKVWDLKYS